MGQYFSVFGSADFVPESKSVILKTMLSNCDGPFNKLLGWHDTNGHNDVVFTTNQDNSIEISIKGGSFFNLGRHIYDLLEDIISLGFKAYGSFFINTNDGENWSELLELEGDTVKLVKPSKIPKDNFLKSLHSHFCSCHVDGYIEFYKDIVDIEELADTIGCIDAYDGFIYFSNHLSLRSHNNITGIVDFVLANKDLIKNCSLSTTNYTSHYFHYSIDNGSEATFQLLVG